MNNLKVIIALLICMSGYQLKAENKSAFQSSDDTIRVLIPEMQQLLEELQRMQTELSLQLRELQEELQRIDTTSNTEITIGNRRVTIVVGDVDTARKKRESMEEERKNIETNLFLIDIGVLNILHDNDFSLPGEYSDLEIAVPRSRNLTLHLVQQSVNLIDHKLFMIYGLSLDYRNFHFRESVTLLPQADTLAFVVNPEISYRRNSLNTRTVMIPLMLQYESRAFDRKNSFRLAGGVYGGYVYNSFSRQVSQTQGRVKLQNDYHLNRVRYGATARMGAGRFTLYGNYDLSPMFKSDKAPEFNPLTVGLVLNGFSW